MTRRRRTPSTELPREAWAACGITVGTTPDGRVVPTHIRGDQHAADIIAGRYPRDRAEREHVSALALAVALARGPGVLSELLRRLDGRPWAPRTRR